MQHEQGGEVSLFSNNREKQHLEDCANLFALLKTLQSIESAYSRGRIDADAYEACCKNLLTQWNSAFTADLKAKVGEASKFARDFNMSVDRALRRVADGQPATVSMHRMAAREKDLIVECVQQSSLLENCVSLNFEVKDIILYLRQFLNAAGRLSAAPKSGEAAAMQAWLTKLDSMSYSATLSEDERSRMVLDIQRLVDAIRKG